MLEPIFYILLNNSRYLFGIRYALSYPQQFRLIIAFTMFLLLAYYLLLLFTFLLRMSIAGYVIYSHFSFIVI